MNCNNCELKCSNQQNYCKLCGDDLKKYNTNTIKFYKNDFCEICGEKQNKGNRYCSKCGNNLSFIDKDKEIKWNFKDPDNIKAFIKSRFKVPIVSILMLILISIIIKCILGFVESDINKYLNVFNILMGVNLVPIDISSSSNLGFGKININLGIILWIIIPAICITISSIIFIKKDEIDKTNILKETLIISIIYGAFIAFVSILAKRTISLSMNEYYNLSIILSYSLCKSFINGILVCFIPTYITLYNKVKPKENIYKIINKVLKTIGTLLIIILITLIVCFVFNKLYLNSEGIMTLVMLVQISTYIIHLANLIPMIIINSIISIFSMSNLVMYINDNMLLVIYSIILFNAILLIVAGYDVKNKFKNQKYIKIFSLIYSIVIGVSIHLTKIDTNGTISLLESKSYETYSYIGSSAILGMMISFLYCYIMLFIGYKLNKE
ncbi:hypothetical protein [Paraclostridium sordellii]|uniref:hypothetical protein n=1 Tax=Paraclostridium sordellii TaxID=1505 RepID=UPI0005E41DEC|nr:hypothetical protein [Paeniclostridium sordellii]CEO20686.1 membrane protein [[Clostridium] sordellii] [Paeniclostridium sordellii]